MQKSEKSYYSIPRKNRKDGQTDGRTDDTEFIRPHYRGSKITMQILYIYNIRR